MTEFGLVKPFGIDNGELDGMTPQECFVLGYELAAIDAMLEKPDAFEQMCHAANIDRITKFCEMAGRNFRFIWMEGDKSEMWVTLYVGRGDKSRHHNPNNETGDHQQS